MAEVRTACAQKIVIVGVEPKSVEIGMNLTTEIKEAASRVI